MFNNFSGKVAGEEHKLMLVCEKMGSNELSVITKYLIFFSFGKSLVRK
jgi:hypothetical protein